MSNIRISDLVRIKNEPELGFWGVRDFPPTDEDVDESKYRLRSVSNGELRTLDAAEIEPTGQCEAPIQCNEVVIITPKELSDNPDEAKITGTKGYVNGDLALCCCGS